MMATAGVCELCSLFAIFVMASSVDPDQAAPRGAV